MLKIWKAEIVGDGPGSDALSRGRGEPAGRPCPGEILSATKSGIVVACGGNALRILELQPEGGKRLTAEQFLAGHFIQPGEKFTS